MSDYSAASIRVLKDLEPVKERPGMYTRTTCPTHIVQEVIDNAADEALAGFAKKIPVAIRADGVIEVSDNGRGIPVEIHPEEGKPAVEPQYSITPLMSGDKNIQEDKEKISFSFWGDSQGGWNTFGNIVQKMAGFDDDFSVGLGDLVGDGSQESEYILFRDALNPLQKKMPLFFTPGNHDYDGYYDDLIPQNYLKHISGEKTGKTYYDFYVGKAAFIALDPNRNFPLAIDATKQNWMLQTMQTKSWKEADWRFIVIHQPPYGQGWVGYEG